MENVTEINSAEVVASNQRFLAVEHDISARKIVPISKVVASNIDNFVVNFKGRTLVYCNVMDRVNESALRYCLVVQFFGCKMMSFSNVIENIFTPRNEIIIFSLNKSTEELHLRSSPFLYVIY